MGQLEAESSAARVPWTPTAASRGLLALGGAALALALAGRAFMLQVEYMLAQAGRTGTEPEWSSGWCWSGQVTCGPDLAYTGRLVLVPLPVTAVLLLPVLTTSYQTQRF